MDLTSIIPYVISHLDRSELNNEISLLGLSKSEQADVLKAAYDPSKWEVGDAEPIRQDMYFDDVLIPKGSTCHRVYLEDGFDALYVDLYLSGERVLTMHLGSD